MHVQYTILYVQYSIMYIQDSNSAILYVQDTIFYLVRTSLNSRLTADSNYTGSLIYKISRYIRQFTQAQARLQVHRLFNQTNLP